MKALIFDIEANGLLDTITEIHCISIMDIENPSFIDLYHESEGESSGSISEGIERLQGADLLIGHNISGYDIQAIEKVKGVRITSKLYDTLVAAQLIFPTIPEAFHYDRDTGNRITRKGHSLKAWGMRLNCYKHQIETDWKKYTDQMGLYCIQDIRVTYELYRHLSQQNWPQSSLDFEMDVARIIADIGNYGIYFDTDKAQELYAELIERRKILADEAQAVFPPWYKFKSMFTYKKDNLEVCKVELTQFNPGSRAHIIDRLKNKYNWNPSKFTEKGNPIMDEKVLDELDYPEAKKLSQLFMIDKRIGQIATGKEAWLSKVKEDGRIHGRINQNGARTGRCTHSQPNLSQVPKEGKEYGKECRQLFKASPGKIFVGCDFTGLEYAVLAGYMVKYDGGRLKHIVETGDKNKGTDIHTINAQALGIDRNTAKTLLYAMMYGGGDEKAGTIINPGMSVKQKKEVGREIRNNLLDSLVGIKDFLEDIKKSYRPRAKKVKNLEKEFDEYVDGWIRGLDGRQVYCGYEYQALNTLIQSAGALITKRGLVDLVKLLEEDGLTQNKEYGIVVYSHDEWVIECNEKDVNTIKRISLEACKSAGEYFKFPCKMSGEVREGLNWAEVH